MSASAESPDTDLVMKSRFLARMRPRVRVVRFGGLLRGLGGAVQRCIMQMKRQHPRCKNDKLIAGHADSGWIVWAVAVLAVCVSVCVW